MPYKLTIKLPGLPPLQNKLNTMHWLARNSSNKKWTKWVMLSVSGQKPIAPLKRARVTFTRHSSALCDHDNLVGSFKSIQDALVKCGILEDDNTKVLESHYEWYSVSPKKGSISISIEEVLDE